MKTYKYFLIGSVAASMAVFQGCGDCNQQITQASTECEQRLNTVKDSIMASWNKDLDSLRQTYMDSLANLDSLILASTATTGKTGTKKGTGTKTTTKTPAKDENKRLDVGQQQPGDKRLDVGQKQNNNNKRLDVGQ